MEQRSRSFYVLASFFGLYVLFLYGPTITIGILSFQGPGGGLTFPMRGVSLHWYDELFQQQAVGDIWGAWRRSVALGLMVIAMLDRSWFFVRAQALPVSDDDMILTIAHSIMDILGGRDHDQS